MSEPLHIRIQHDGLLIYGRGPEDADTLVPAAEEAELRKKLAEHFLARGGRREVLLFVSEDLVFYKTIVLPGNTRDLDEAVGFQVGMLAPFAEDDLLYCFEAERQKKQYQVHLACVSRELVEPVLREFAAADIRIAGLHPEYLRYLSRNAPRERWGLFLAGRLHRVLVFEGRRLKERLLLPAPAAGMRLAELAGTELLYAPAPQEGDGLRDARPLVVRRGAIKEYNLLPPAFRRPDYSKFLIAALLVLNLLALLGFVGGRLVQARDYEARIAAAIDEVAPLAREAVRLRQQEKALQAAVGEFKSLSPNPDLIGFFERLTKGLPENAYLDQLRFDGRSRAVIIQGYTDDIGALAAKLGDLGDARLKSTSRRRNKIYFNIEISMP